MKSLAEQKQYLKESDLYFLTLLFKNNDRIKDTEGYYSIVDLTAPGENPENVLENIEKFNIKTKIVKDTNNIYATKVQIDEKEAQHIKSELKEYVLLFYNNRLGSRFTEYSGFQKHKNQINNLIYDIYNDRGKKTLVLNLSSLGINNKQYLMFHYLLFLDFQNYIVILDCDVKPDDVFHGDNSEYSLKIKIKNKFINEITKNKIIEENAYYINYNKNEGSVVFGVRDDVEIIFTKNRASLIKYLYDIRNHNQWVSYTKEINWGKFDSSDIFNKTVNEINKKINKGTSYIKSIISKKKDGNKVSSRNLYKWEIKIK